MRWIVPIEAQDESRLDQALRAINALVPVLGPSIARLKYGQSVLGMSGGPTRMSIDPPDSQLRESIDAALDDARHQLA